MNRQKMPTAEVAVDVGLVRSLLDSQRPDLADEAVTPLAFGWDNVSFRLGDSRVARFPRREVAVGLITNEARWLPHVAPRLPLSVPTPEFVGEPGVGYPWSWLVVPYLKGQSAAVSKSLDIDQCALQLGRFLACLHTPAPDDAPVNPYRGVPLASRDEKTRRQLSHIANVALREGLESLWVEALAADEFSGPPLWLHGDLHPHNLLVSDGKLSGVIDFGDITSGDPAVDLAVAWSFLAAAPDAFWKSYGRADEVMKVRARGWAVALGLAYVSNSADNPVMEAVGERTLAAVVNVS